MFSTNNFQHYALHGDHAFEVKAIMHTSILKDLLSKFVIDFIQRVELVAISNKESVVFVRVVLQDMSYIAKYSFSSFIQHSMNVYIPPTGSITAIIMPHDFIFEKMSFLADNMEDTIVVEKDYIERYARIYRETPFKLLS